MNCYEFLCKVLPDANQGAYIATFKKQTNGGFWNEGFATIEELAAASINASNRKRTAYYALGTFTDNLSLDDDGREHWQRKAAQAIFFRTFALDVDCGEGKPYPTQRDGARALLAFLASTKLPEPMVVSSGNGLHCYWPLVKHIKRDQWVATSLQLKALCVQHKFEIDQSKVHDASMVLRPVGTVNFKGGNIVTLLKDAAAFDAATLIALIGSMQPIAATPPTPIKLSTLSAVSQAVLSGAETYPPADGNKIVKHCLQMQQATAEGGKNANEPAWWAAAGIAKACIDPEATYIKWSSGHAGYEHGKTLAKLAEWNKTTGPTTCVVFDQRVPGVCARCPHWEKIGSPARLGAPDPIPVTISADEIAPIGPFDAPPFPFMRASDGSLQVEQSGVYVSFFDYDLFPVQIIRDPATGYEETVWLWNKPHKGYTDVKVRTSYIFNDQVKDLVSCLSDNGVLIGNKTKQLQMGQYMKAYVQKLQKAQPTTELYDSFGWKNNYTNFVIGSTKYQREEDGNVTAQEVGVSQTLIDKHLDTAFTPSGDLATWTAWTRVLDAPGLEGHQFALGIAFAAPLIVLTGLSGFFISLLGEGGEGKSTMQAWINSVYGSPKRLGMKKEDTKLSFVQRMGQIAHLPLTIDEATLIEALLVADLAYWTTQGQDKNRQNTSIASNWALPGIISTNKSMRDKLISTSADTDAVSMRLLEFTFQKNMVFDDSKGMGKQISLILQQHYGHAGRHYLQGLLSIGEAKLRKYIDQWTLRVEEIHGSKFAGKERYWAVGVCLPYFGNFLAKEMGLVKYDPEKGVRWALAQLGGQRHQVDEAKLSSYDMIANYLNENNGLSLTVFYNNDKPVVQDPLPRGEIRIRKEIHLGKNGKPERGFLYFDRFHFQRWLVKSGFDIKHILTTIEEDKAVFRPNKSSRLYMGMHTPLKLGQVAVVGLNLSHERLHGMLDQERSLTLMPSEEKDRIFRV